MYNREFVKALLLELETGCQSADDVANRLCLLGIRGTRKSSCDCVLANYFAMHQIPVKVGLYGIHAVVPNELGNYDDTMVALPKYVYHFRTLYDQGQYSDLEFINENTNRKTS